MVTEWRDYIDSTPDILRGKPRLKGTRIPVTLVLGYLAEGRSAAEIRDQLPDVTDAHVSACLAYARDLTEFEAVS